MKKPYIIIRAFQKGITYRYIFQPDGKVDVETDIETGFTQKNLDALVEFHTLVKEEARSLAARLTSAAQAISPKIEKFEAQVWSEL